MYRSTSTSTPSRPTSRSTSTSSSTSSEETPSNLPSSSSLPLLPTTSTPPRPNLHSTPSTQHLRSPQTPASTSKNKNFHPYLIQTTSSSLLSRTNSSPAQPLYEGGIRHRVSRSMSALSKPESIRDNVSEASASASEDGDGMTPGQSPLTKAKAVRVGMKRSGTLPSFPSSENLREKSRSREVELPNDPKIWTASELAQYLSKSLRKGSDNTDDQTLPAPLIEDIKSWILRHQVTGRAFLKGPETWTTSSRPPPFLPLLTSISRRLRRSSLHSRISNSNSATITEDSEDGFGPSSVLVEEDEERHPQGVVRGVRGMAQAYDAIHSSTSASEASISGDESLVRQNTGEHRRQVWKKWEAEMRPLKRQDTGSSIGSVDEVMLAAARGLPIKAVEASVFTDEEEEEEDGKGGTIKPNLMRTSIVPVELSSSGSSASPPSAYLSSSPDNPVETSRDFINTSLLTPVKAEGGRSHSVTPTPDPQRVIEATSPLPTRLAISTNGRQSLGRSTSRKLPLPISLLEEGTETDDEHGDGKHYSAARRVTIRPPARVSSRTIFNPPPKSEREIQLETELGEMKARLEELEARFNSVESSSTKGDSQVVAPNDITSYIFGKLGLGKDGKDGLPNSVGELPAYLFLVGFGVGAVFVKVLFSRK